MRVELINKFGGCLTVDEKRLDEYLAAGFKRPAVFVEEKEDVKEKPIRKRTSRKKEV